MFIISENEMGGLRGLGRLGVRAAPAIVGRVGQVRQVGQERRVRRVGQVVSRPKNGLQLFCQFNLCFLFFKLSVVSKNSFITSV